MFLIRNTKSSLCRHNDRMQQNETKCDKMQQTTTKSDKKRQTVTKLDKFCAFVEFCYVLLHFVEAQKAQIYSWA